jgi:predicted Zn-dependent peptidase
MLGYYEAVMGDYQELFRIRERLDQVKAEDIQRVARSYFDADRRTALTLVPIKGEK